MLSIVIPQQFFPYMQYLPTFLIALITTFLLTPIIGVIAKHFNIIDLPAKERGIDDKTAPRRIHKDPQLLLGGIAVVIPFLLISLLSIPVSKYFWGVIVGTVIVFICGVLDDIFELSAKVQAIFQVLAAFVVVAFGLEIETIRNPFGPAINLRFLELTLHTSIRFLPAALLTIIWIFFIINAIKWVAGTDGLVEGNSAIAALIIGLLSVRFQTHETAIMGFALAGALFGFLYFNFYPLKIRSGSSGKTVYGFLLAVLAIYSGGRVATFILTMSLPIIDAIWVIIYRIRTYHPKTIFQLFSISDKSHIHFRLLDLGFSQKQVAFIEYTFTLITGTFAFFLTGLHKALAIGIFIILIIILYILITIFLKKNTKIQQLN